MTLNKSMAEVALAYAVYKFGKHERLSVPKLIFSKRDVGLFGEYIFAKNKIIVYGPIHLTSENPIQELFDTVCHEYEHYLHSNDWTKNRICKKKLETRAKRFGRVTGNKLYKILYENIVSSINKG